MREIRIITTKPVALDSLDHTNPLGTANDNSSNFEFNKKLFKLIPQAELSVLDLGCAGGGFIKSLLDANVLAVGIEGSDYSQKIKRAEWQTIPDNLFTADITEPFQLVEINENQQEKKLKFNLITAWEVLEHIKENQLVDVFKNIERHLAPQGTVIFSVSATRGTANNHQTVKNKKWWLKIISNLGFANQQKAVYYFGHSWVRGLYDTPKNFHFVLTRTGEKQYLINKLKTLPRKIKLRIFITRVALPLLIIEMLIDIKLKNRYLKLKNKTLSIIKLK